VDHEALDALVIEQLAALVTHAEAEHDLFQVLELVGEHADRPRRPRLIAAHHITIQEQALCVRGTGQAGDGGRQCDRGKCRGLHESAPSENARVAFGLSLGWMIRAPRRTFQWSVISVLIPTFSVLQLSLPGSQAGQ